MVGKERVSFYSVLIVACSRLSLVGVTGGKRRGDSSSVADSDDAKRSRVSTATGGPQSAGSSSSPSPQPPLLRPTPHRSPVIKYNLLPYNIGQFPFLLSHWCLDYTTHYETLVLCTIGGATVIAGAVPGQQATPTSLTQTVILSITPNTTGAVGTARLSPHPTLVQATPPSSTPSTPPSFPTVTPSLSSSSIPPNLLITILRCFGPLQVYIYSGDTFMCRCVNFSMKFACLYVLYRSLPPYQLINW